MSTGRFPALGLTPDAQAERAAKRLAGLLSARQQTLAVAESCTGGWIAKLLTDLPGSSAWFGYGIVSYANAAKSQVLKVRESTLEANGAVSEPVVREMAEGVRLLARSDYAIATSGIAGPDGGSVDKPVGTVWASWASAGQTRAKMERFSGDREAVRIKTVAWVLDELVLRLSSDES